jgi:hypothetical protein
MSTDLMPTPRQQFRDLSGNPLASGKLYFYISGTSTPLATYTDVTGTIQNSNPVILDSGGFATVWLGAGQYRVKVTDANDVQQWVVDSVTSSTFGPSTTDTLQNKTLTGRSGNNSVTLLTASGSQIALSGTGADLAVFTYSIPANQIGPGKGFRFSCGFSHTGSATITYKLSIGAQVIGGYSAATASFGSLTSIVMNKAGVQNAQFGYNFPMIISGSIGNQGQITAFSFDFSAVQILSFTFNGPTTDQVMPLFSMLELIQ